MVISKVDIATFHEQKSKRTGPRTKIFKLENDSEGPAKLKIICMKMPINLIQQMDSLVTNDLYFSRSEVIRSAVRHLLAKGDDAWEAALDAIPFRGQDPTFEEIEKVSISAKLPLKLFTCVDMAVTKGLFASRSQLIRQSLQVYLIERERIHNYIN
jgi:Arc/MetJ-type ribon-helix-helix transcriptional regulator